MTIVRYFFKRAKPLQAKSALKTTNLNKLVQMVFVHLILKNSLVLNIQKIS